MGRGLAIVVFGGIYLIGMLVIGFAVSKRAQTSFRSYTIADKSFSGLLIALTLAASAIGAGDLFGNADAAYHQGLVFLAWVLGNGAAKLSFALIGGFLAKYAYLTIADFAENLIVKDKLTKAIVGILVCLPALAWTGAQAMCIGLIYTVFTGNDPLPVIILATLVFIVYTAIGGFRAVVLTDAVQMLLIFVCGAAYFVGLFGKIGFSLGNLATRVQAVDPRLWSLASVAPVKLATYALSTLCGVSIYQTMWQRAFACSDSRSATRAFLFNGVVGITAMVLTVFAGIIARVLNPNLQTGVAAWLVSNVLPVWLQVSFVLAIAAATMSSADSFMNVAAISIVNDVIKPYKPNLTDRQMIRYTMFATVAVGLASLIGSLKFKFIVDYANLAFAGAGGTLVPFLLIGLFWRKNPKQSFSADNSMLTATSARAGLLCGLVAGIAGQLHPSVKAMLGGGVIPALVVTSVVLVVTTLATRSKTDVISPVHADR